MELERTHVDDARLLRLLQLYVHEWSALLPIPIGRDALFVYEELDAWRDGARHDAWLCLEDARPVGFALTSVDDTGTAHVEELFVIAGARRRGLGGALALALVAFTTR